MKLLKIGILLVLSGFILVLLSIILVAIVTVDHGVAGAVCVVIFFIPVCYGTGPPFLLILLSLIVFVLALVFILSTMLVTYRLLSSRTVSKQKEYILHLFNFRLKTL